MGRCCGPNGLENMHPAQQSSAATMRAVTAAVLADAASVLADAASALADTASALADTTQKFIQAQICVCCKYRSVFICWYVTFSNTALYLQIQPLYLQIRQWTCRCSLCTCRCSLCTCTHSLCTCTHSLCTCTYSLCACTYSTKVHASTDLHLLQIQICICFQSCDIYHHKHTTSRSLTGHERSWPGLSDLLTDLHKRCAHKLCKCTCTQNCALAHKIVHLHSFCAHLNFRTQYLAEVQIPARLLFEFINLGTPTPNQSQ